MGCLLQLCHFHGIPPPHHSIQSNASHSWNTFAEHLQGRHRSLPHLKDEKVALKKVAQVEEKWGVISIGCDDGPGGGEFWVVLRGACGATRIVSGGHVDPQTWRSGRKWAHRWGWAVGELCWELGTEYYKARAQGTAFIKGRGCVWQPFCIPTTTCETKSTEDGDAHSCQLPEALCLPGFCSGRGQTALIMVVWEETTLFPSCLRLSQHSPGKSVSDCAPRASGDTACWSVGWSGGSLGCGHHLEVHTLTQWSHPVQEKSNWVTQQRERWGLSIPTAGLRSNNFWGPALCKHCITFSNTSSDLVFTATPGDHYCYRHFLG